MNGNTMQLTLTERDVYLLVGALGLMKWAIDFHRPAFNEATTESWLETDESLKEPGSLANTLFSTSLMAVAGIRNRLEAVLAEEEAISTRLHQAFQRGGELMGEMMPWAMDQYIRKTEAADTAEARDITA